MKIFVGFLLTLVTLAMNIGYEWSVNESISSAQLESLKHVTIAAGIMGLITLTSLGMPRRVGKIEPNQKTFEPPKYHG